MSEVWKGHEPWKKCERCGTSQPDRALVSVPNGASSTLLCRNKVWCSEQLKRLLDARKKLNGHGEPK